MSRLMWNVFDYEVGVDRGVLYIPEASGIAWNGLISVNEQPTGGDVTPYFIDGVKYLDQANRDDFEAVIEAYTYPDEFLDREERRDIFGFSYRTMVGASDYHIHLIYNARVNPVERFTTTIADDVDLSIFSWPIITKTNPLENHAPTAHLIVDSRDTPPGTLDLLEDILYGTPGAEPRLPTFNELVNLFRRGIYEILDAGYLGYQYTEFVDSGSVDQLQTETIDGGGP